MFDVLIIGLGCAGYTAAVYTARYKLRAFIVGLEEGGLGMTAAEVGNWPGDIDVTGPVLMERYKQHALSFGEIVTHRIARVEKVHPFDYAPVRGPEPLRAEWQGDVRQQGFCLTLQSGENIEGRTVIFTTGSNKRHLGVPGEAEFSGKGVTYCATCDAFFYRGKDVAVVGGGDSAVEGAAIAAQVARKVYLIHRRNQFRAEPYWVDRVKAKENVVLVLERNVVEVFGDQKVRWVRLDKEWNSSIDIPLDGVFIEVGATPAVDLATAMGCALDARGFLNVDSLQRTNVKGVFAAGDVTSNSNYFAQFTTAAGEASVAANSVFNYLQAGH